MRTRCISLALAGSLTLVALLLGCAPRAHAQSAVAVCAPDNPGQCLMPSNGALPTTPTCNGTACSQANPFYTVFAAGEFHVGEMGSNQISIATSFTPSAATYPSGQAVGGLQTLANAVRVSAAAGQPGTSGDVLSSVLTFAIAVTAPFDVVYFNAAPAGATCTDNTAFALGAADIAKVIGVAHLTDLTVGNPATIVQAIGPPLPYSLASATSLFACVVARGSQALTAVATNLGVRVLRQ